MKKVKLLLGALDCNQWFPNWWSYAW